MCMYANNCVLCIDACASLPVFPFRFHFLFVDCYFFVVLDECLRLFLLFLAAANSFLIFAILLCALCFCILILIINTLYPMHVNFNFSYT